MSFIVLMSVVKRSDCVARYLKDVARHLNHGSQCLSKVASRQNDEARFMHFAG